MRKLRSWEFKQGHTASTREVACDPLWTNILPQPPNYLSWLAPDLTSFFFFFINKAVLWLYIVFLPPKLQPLQGDFLVSLSVYVQAEYLLCPPPTWLGLPRPCEKFLCPMLCSSSSRNSSGYPPPIHFQLSLSAISWILSPQKILKSYECDLVLKYSPCRWSG